MKKRPVLFFLLLCTLLLQLNAQEKNDSLRIHHIATTLNQLTGKIPGLLKTVDFNVSKMELPIFVTTIANSHQINVSLDYEGLKNAYLTHNFSKAVVKDIFLYLCKEHAISIDYVGNILSFKKYRPQPKKVVYVPKEIPISYANQTNKISLDLKNDSLSVVFRKISDVTGKNLMYAPLDLGKKKVTAYIQETSFESAIEKMAFINNLTVTKTKDNFYVFEENFTSTGKKGAVRRPKRYRKTNFFFKIKDKNLQKLDVDFENVAVADIVDDISLELGINVFTASPLTKAGKATVKANGITFNVLLNKVFENTVYTYKLDNGIYYFGERKQATLKRTVVIPLQHRSIEIMNEPMSSQRKTFNSGNTTNTNAQNNGFGNQNGAYNNQNNAYRNQNTSIGNSSGLFNSRQKMNPQSTPSFSGTQSKGEALLSLFPKTVVQSLDISTDIEQNSFIVTGDAQKIEEFKAFIKKIDKPVPVIIIEVMILEVSKTTSVSTGVSFGIGDAPTTTGGSLFPNANVNLGATTINKIIGGFKGFGTSNLGKVVPNFYAKIEALETNGDVKIKSTPRLSTLNGHQATLSNGERSYYAVTQRNIYGSQNPQTSEIKNYVPIDADLSIAIRPLVSGDGQITMSINVVQSSFNEKRIDEDAPPGVNSREFTSTIRVKDQDVIILGGLEEHVNNNSGSGVPFLARIPIIKYLFSKRTRTASKTKLSVLIKPVIID